ncbi:MAG: FAD-dependent monooxygenase [Lachnospiraceae bacterium]|nr:FAD-dependent monooxygenase [Lachnospiraceae bacterium]
MIQINGLKIPVSDIEVKKAEYPEGKPEELCMKLLEKEVSVKLHCLPEDINHIKILKRSIDARKKPAVFFVYSLCVKVKKETELLKRCRRDKMISLYKKPVSLKETIVKVEKRETVAVIGAGPAGLFAAYYLALCGLSPIIFERGETVDERKKKVDKFWTDGTLDENTNISFGEGGAGTFSDGKLNTGAKDKFGRIRFVLETFVECGASPDILIDAKPHIGTDVLQNVIKTLRQKIIDLGGEFHFQTKLSGFETKQDKLQKIVVEHEGKSTAVPVKYCILAIGHSARDTFSYLKERGVHMEAKPFAIGVRTEHLQSDIDEMQYGMKHNLLPAADYKCTGTGINNRGVYSFCMCPGGFVVNASSEHGGLVVNGMSNEARDGKNANSAIVVTVTPEDFDGNDVLAGVEFQRKLERAAFLLGNGKVPVQQLGDFKKNISTKSFGRVTPSVKGGTIVSNVRSILPDYISQSILAGFEQFGKRMKGFDDDDTLLEGVETRTSSPVRILRREDYQSTAVYGLYPCGEGAGYAGGIMSAAMDGIKVAQGIAISLHEGNSNVSEGKEHIK